jgi:ATP-dependent DNA ligase
MQAWTYPSSSGPGTYTVTLADDGLLSCNCRGFIIKKQDKPRYCRHTDDVVKKLKLTMVQRGDYQFSVGEGEIQADLITQPDHAEAYKTAFERGYVNPMLAVAPTKGQKLTDYNPAEWAMEEKYDGERKVVSVHQGRVYAWSRPRAGKGEVGIEDPLPAHLEAAFKCLPDGTYDGELILPDPGAKSWDVSRLENRPRLHFVAFDLLRVLSGIDTKDFTYAERRRLLEIAINNLRWDGEPSLYVGRLYEPTMAEVQKIWDRHGEGAIVKRKTSKYKPGWRCPEWVKVKLLMTATLAVTGYTKGKNGPYSSVNLVDERGIATRVKTKDNHWLRQIQANPDSFIGRRLVIEFQGFTSDGKYRHPMWDHWTEEGE